MMFWIGLIIGACVGTMFGVLVIALCQSAGDADRLAGYKE
jgi:ABC-type uncharacterized transport system permease subunit